MSEILLTQENNLLSNQVKKYPIVIKRNGDTVKYNFKKIEASITKASEATKEVSEKAIIQIVAQEVAEQCLEYQEISIEAIQDLVEKALFKRGFFQTAKAYIIYREKHTQIRQDSKAFVDAISSINEYVDRHDWRVYANANQNYSVGGLILSISGKMTANYWLNHVYTPYIKEAHINGSLHIHDLDMLSGYCAGWSLRTLLYEGFNGCPGKVESSPPKHFRTALGQMVNFLGTLQNEWAGAQAFSSFDTYLAPYVRIDKLSYKEVYQGLQEFIYNLNVPSRWGSQPPFTNLTFDWVCPDDLKDKSPLIGGEESNLKYGELQEEMDMINRAYIEVMLKGDTKGRIFTFPIPTYNITPEFDWEHSNCELLFKMTGKYGLPYFQNFINSDLKPHMIRSMCCRLQLDLSELLKRGNGLFGSAEQTGSVGVVTINCARFGYLHKGSENELLGAVENLCTIAKNSLETKRKVIQKLIDEGLFPYTKRYLGTLRNHFSTIGINGVNECIRNFSNDAYDITSPEGYELAHKILDKVRSLMKSFQEETGNLYNLEASPAEGATYRFAKEDKKRFPNILQAGTEANPYYTNSSQLPVDYTEDAFAALEHQELLQRKYTGGTVFHMYLPEHIDDPNTCKELVKKTLSRFRIPYLTLSPTFSICPTHGYLAGEQETCPTCGNTCEVWTRVMGYHRPVSSFNKGKVGEYQERKEFCKEL